MGSSGTLYGPGHVEVCSVVLASLLPECLEPGHVSAMFLLITLAQMLAGLHKCRLAVRLLDATGLLLIPNSLLTLPCFLDRAPGGSLGTSQMCISPSAGGSSSLHDAGNRAVSCTPLVIHQGQNWSHKLSTGRKRGPKGVAMLLGTHSSGRHVVVHTLWLRALVVLLIGCDTSCHCGGEVRAEGTHSVGPHERCPIVEPFIGAFSQNTQAAFVVKQSSDRCCCSL